MSYKCRENFVKRIFSGSKTVCVINSAPNTPILNLEYKLSDFYVYDPLTFYYDNKAINNQTNTGKLKNIVA